MWSLVFLFGLACLVLAFLWARRDVLHGIHVNSLSHLALGARVGLLLVGVLSVLWAAIAAVVGIL